MVRFAVELCEGYPEVGADLFHDDFHGLQVVLGEDVVTVFCYKDQVCM